jgi:hypothetical protein
MYEMEICCRDVCSAFSGQLRSGVGAFFLLKRYERKQPLFVGKCVRMWFGQRVRVILWGIEGMSGLVWEAFSEFVYAAFQILM